MTPEQTQTFLLFGFIFSTVVAILASMNKNKRINQLEEDLIAKTNYVNTLEDRNAELLNRLKQEERSCSVLRFNPPPDEGLHRLKSAKDGLEYALAYLTKGKIKSSDQVEFVELLKLIGDHEKKNIRDTAEQVFIEHQ